MLVSTDPNIQMLASLPSIDARLDVAYDGVRGIWSMSSAWLPWLAPPAR